MSANLLPPATEDGLGRLEAWRESSAMLQWLDFSARIESGDFAYRLAFDDRHIGNEFLRAIHGGVVSTFLQVSAHAELLGRLEGDIDVRVTSTHCEFLRPAKALDLHGKATIVQRGSRIAFLDVICWQDDPNKPVAKSAITARL